MTHSHLAGSDYGLASLCQLSDLGRVCCDDMCIVTVWFSGSSGQGPTCCVPLHVPLIAPG